MPLEITYQRPWMYPEQQDAIFDETRIAMIEASTKAGKAQPLDSIICTPAGLVAMRDIEVGQEVLTPTGTARVVGVYPQGEREVFRVTFSDGSSTESTMDHLWEVLDRKGNVRVMTLAEIKAVSPHSRRLMAIPRVAAHFEAQPVPIHPYVLGALIGDGCLRGETLRFSSTDEALLSKMRALLPSGYTLEHIDRCDYRVRLVGPYQSNPDRLIPALKQLGLWGATSSDKFIPDVYRLNSHAVRLEVLRGILDTDGFVSRHGQPEIDQTSARLANNIQELVEGLGGFARKTTRRGAYTNENGERVQCKTVYRLRIVYPNSSELFSLERKVKKCRDRRKPTRRTFRKIDFSRRTEAQCIMIDDPRGVYLTDHMIATHNTAGCLAWLSEQAFVKGKIGREFWWVAPVYGQAKIAYRRMKTSLPRNVYRQNETELRLTLINGAAIEFRSAEKPDNLYGEDVWAVVMDESSRMREEAWHAVRSTLTHTRGPVRMIGNVHGRKNWFYRLARLAEAGDSDMSYHRLTALDAVRGGVMDADEVEAARRDFHRLGKDGIFRQLYMAEAADDGENPFGLDAIRACCDGVEELSSEYPAAAGVDLAGRGAQNIAPRQTSPVDRDYTAVVMLDRDGHATRIERFRKPHTETTEHVARAVGRAPALVDSTGTGDAIVEALQRRGDMQVLGYTFTERSRQELLEHLALYIGEGDVHWPDADDGAKLRLELESFEYVYRRTGVSWRVPEGAHDDIAMALALCAKRMPWRMKRALAPSGVEAPGGSKWTGNAVDGTAWARYQDSLKPTVVSGLVDESVAVPPLIQGPGAGKWK